MTSEDTDQTNEPDQPDDAGEDTPERVAAGKRLKDSFRIPDAMAAKLAEAARPAIKADEMHATLARIQNSIISPSVREAWAEMSKTAAKPFAEQARRIAEAAQPSPAILQLADSTDKYRQVLDTMHVVDIPPVRRYDPAELVAPRRDNELYDAVTELVQILIAQGEAQQRAATELRDNEIAKGEIEQKRYEETKTLARNRFVVGTIVGVVAAVAAAVAAVAVFM